MLPSGSRGTLHVLRWFISGLFEMVLPLYTPVLYACICAANQTLAAKYLKSIASVLNTCALIVFCLLACLLFLEQWSEQAIYPSLGITVIQRCCEGHERVWIILCT